jgi:hypothetical protein
MEEPTLRPHRKRARQVLYVIPDVLGKHVI